MKKYYSITILAIIVITLLQGYKHISAVRKLHQ